MENNKVSELNKPKFVFLALYFVILTIERIISLCSCFAGGTASFTALDWYMVLLTVASIIGAYAFGGSVLASANKKPDGFFGRFSIAAGILLLSGMVHTNGSIPPIQFASYGMILISMTIHTVQQIKLYRGGDTKWLSFAYIVAFSMAIPVVYHTNIMLANLFIPIEIIVSAGMVVLFTIMLKRFYDGNGESSFSLAPYIAALIGDFIVIIMRWHEEVNLFVLIFISITSVLWFAGNILSLKKK